MKFLAQSFLIGVITLSVVVAFGMLFRYIPEIVLKIFSLVVFCLLIGLFIRIGYGIIFESSSIKHE